MVGDVALLTQLPSDAWFEGFAQRPNGQLLMTRLDQPELYTLDAEDPDAEPQLVYTFEDATAAVNLCPIKGKPDEYVVITAMLDLATVYITDHVMWHVTLKDGQDIKVEMIAELDAGAAIGVIPVSERLLLIADSFRGTIQRFDLSTGKTSVLVDDDALNPATEGPYGINRLRLTDGYVWFTNNGTGTLYRFPVKISDSDIEMTGPIQLISDEIPHCDGLAVTPDMKEAYTASYVDGWLWKLDIDPESGKSELAIVMENLVSPTAVEIMDSNGKPKIFVVCCGEVEVGWVNSADKTSWSEFRDLSVNAQVSVTITEEVVESA
ncbi:hypothetical protein JX265_009343 [Neoarthrinium moseri]|uniref:SMP-30/Gluconolactonase/LRE-like region domain-containing protein n=1 Tax=Neoarthrinium moseri TaxID=1658444 RepID=A0A9P9WG38_9PEZI|nr:uncharacterized protein JN550_011809 [Neoarthrinium moseri]KAI1840097.1 hypothetical protein JX266_013700 [Neoarthrinium moseri]KAI1859890.1 hypothetical protein JN550_011809 [Neoarthrinium moseri]KAI1861840.1 hypothetical protein JX265_009343 [Neoarthrinium moseri]